jgi:hypothetical protein
MNEPKRKFDSQINLIEEMEIEDVNERVGSSTDGEHPIKKPRKTNFKPQMIFEIIERIKEL